MTEIEQKRKSRKKHTAEDFTPEPLIKEMLDKLPQEVWNDRNKTFLDNSAGNGNFLVAILQRKLAYGHDPIKALSTIYGVELMGDNVKEMRDRLLVELPHLSPEEIKKARKIVNHHIVKHNALTWDYENWRKPKKIKKPKAKPLFKSTNPSPIDPILSPKEDSSKAKPLFE